MGMFGEIAADGQAKDLAKVLEAAIASHNPDVMKFCKKYVFPLHQDAMGEAFREETTEEKTLREFYENY